MHKLPLVLFQMLTMIFVIGTIQNPAFAAGALYDAQNKQSQEMIYPSQLRLQLQTDIF